MAVVSIGVYALERFEIAQSIREMDRRAAQRHEMACLAEMSHEDDCVWAALEKRNYLAAYTRDADIDETTHYGRAWAGLTGSARARAMAFAGTE